VPEDAIDLESLWAHAIDGLTDSTVTPQQRAWLRTTRPLGLLDGTALLAAPNEFTKDVLETRLRPMITTALSGLLGREIRVAVTVEPPAAPEVLDAEDTDQVAEDTQPGLAWPPPSRSPRRRPRRTTRCSSMGIRAWVRRTCCTQSAITPSGYFRTRECDT